MQAPTTQQQDQDKDKGHETTSSLNSTDSTDNTDHNDGDDPQIEETTEISPQAYETTHVHNVYNEIAEHFSQTRYKPWPIVSSFLRAQVPGSVGLDVGCGNGKYLAENGHVFILASDMSEQLLRLAKDNHGARTAPTVQGVGKLAAASGQGQDRNQASNDKTHPPNAFILSSTLNLPHPRARFDFAISIAVIHHLSTRERRVAGIREILSCLRVGPTAGQALIYVWALEQQSSRRGWDSSSQQDVMVPWVLAPRRKHERTVKQLETPPLQPPRTYRRYYHLYRQGELQADVEAAGGHVLDAGYEKDNWWAVAVKDAVKDGDMA